MRMKIGTTSYIFPDNIIPNVEKLAGLVDNVQLVLFEGEELSSIPTREDVRRLCDIAARTGITYTIHTPIDLDICSADEGFRQFSLERMAHIMELTSPLEPVGYVLHLPRRGVRSDGKWLVRASKSMQHLIGRIPPERLCIENLTYPARHVLDAADLLGVSLCLDITHAEQSGDSWESIYDAFRSRIRLLHFYGPETREEGHLGLQRADRGRVKAVISKLMSTGYRGVLVLEVFGARDFFESKRILDREIELWLEESQGRC